MENVAHVIDALGGPKEASHLLGISRSLITGWEQDGIPAKRWPQIEKIAALIGKPEITVSVLSRIVPSKPDAISYGGGVA